MVIIFFCFFIYALHGFWGIIRISLWFKEGSFWGYTVYYNQNSMITLKLKLNFFKWADNCHISSLFFLLYFSFSFQAWDSICFYCCWCLTLLDTFVIGEVRWEPQSCYETNTLWSEYKNYVQNLWRLFFHSRNYRK